MYLKATATFERDIDIEEVLDDLFRYDARVSAWENDYEDIIEYYIDDVKAVLEQNKTTVLRACIDLYIQKLQKYRDDNFKENI